MGWEADRQLIHNRVPHLARATADFSNGSRFEPSRELYPKLMKIRQGGIPLCWEGQVSEGRKVDGNYSGDGRGGWTTFFEIPAT